MRGMFITFEGGEGAGKSTQIRRLVERLRSSVNGPCDVVCTREPGGSSGAEQIRTLILGSNGEFDPLAEALLFAAARADHVRKLIIPALDRGAVVICDRFMDSTAAYQGAGSTVPAEIVADLARIAVGGTTPDLTFILDVDPVIGVGRAGRRNASSSVGDDRFEREALDFHHRVRNAFLGIATANSERCHVIDASQSVDDVTMDIWRAVHERIESISEQSELKAR